MKKTEKNRKNKRILIAGIAATGVAVLCIVLAILSARTKINPPINKLPDDYSLEDAKSDGYVIYENQDISQGQEKWDKFLKTSQAGKPCAVRLVFSEKNAKLKIYDLSYNGKEYTLKFMEKDKLVSETYLYLLKSEEIPPIASISSIEKRIIYFLADDPNLTWKQAYQSTMNEQVSGTKAYRYFRVYCNSIYKPAEN
ncbi:MAG: hypothetical protein IJA86_02345 [Clostridia bacterium]|nr:hypothetical protein [Clostridia bacterium]